MMKCGNCSKPAHYIYQITQDVGQPYCAEHVPGFLYARLQAGLLKTTDEWKKDRDDALEILSNSEPVVSSEDEESKPEKKTRSKKSS